MFSQLATGLSATNLVPHYSRTVEKHSRIVGPLNMILPRAVDKTISTVEDLPGLAVYDAFYLVYIQTMRP